MPADPLPPEPIAISAIRQALALRYEGTHLQFSHEGVEALLLAHDVMRGALREIAAIDRDAWVYGRCAKLALAALGVEK